MDQQVTLRHKKIDTQGAKRLVFTLAVTSTLGFWGVFSKLNLDKTVQANHDLQSSGSVPPQQAENQVVLNLPPLPTLVPALDANVSVQAVTPVQQNLTTTSKSAVPLTRKIYLGGSKPSYNQNTPITSTGSSK
jgi:hypothetical protein